MDVSLHSNCLGRFLSQAGDESEKREEERVNGDGRDEIENG